MPSSRPTGRSAWSTRRRSHNPAMTDAHVHVPDGITPTFGGFMRDLAALYGDRPALVFEDGTWTFLQLEQEVRRVAKALLAANVVKGQRVALLGGNRPEWIFAA